MRHRFVVSLLALVTAACARSSESLDVPADTTPVELPAQKNEELASAIGPYRYYSSYNQPVRLVVRTTTDWSAAWDKIVGSVMPKPPLPEIDFEHEMVIVAAMGTRSSGGYSIEVPSVYESQSRLYARVRQTSPGSTCGVTAALTAPVAAVVVPAFSGPVTFLEEAVTHQC